MSSVLVIFVAFFLSLYKSKALSISFHHFINKGEVHLLLKSKAIKYIFLLSTSNSIIHSNLVEEICLLNLLKKSSSFNNSFVTKTTAFQSFDNLSSI